MTFYAFSLDFIETIFQRGKLDDVDVISFTVLINQRLGAHAAGTGLGISGSGIPMGTSAIDQRTGPIVQGGLNNDPAPFGWLAGPFALAPGDSVQIMYSGTNTSDSELGSDQLTKIEVGILDQLLTAGAAAVVGSIASAVSKALSFIGDPVGSLLGIKPEGPCNGTVFGDGIFFPGDSLADLPFDSQTADNFVPDGPDASSTGAKATVFVKPDVGTYTDADTHNTSICGHVAETKVTFSIYRLERAVSLRAYGGKRFGRRTLEGGIRGLGEPPFTVRELLQIGS